MSSRPDTPECVWLRYALPKSYLAGLQIDLGRYWKLLLRKRGGPDENR